jgi:hypothetical protein
VNGDDNGDADPQRHRVVRRVDDLSGELLGDQRQTGLLPRQPSRTMRNGGRAWDHDGLGRHRGVALGVCALTDDGKVGTGGAKCRKKAVDVPPNPTSVGGDSGRVDQHSGGHERLPPRLNRASQLLVVVSSLSVTLVWVSR